MTFTNLHLYAAPQDAVLGVRYRIETIVSFWPYGTEDMRKAVTPQRGKRRGASGPWGMVARKEPESYGAPALGVGYFLFSGGA